jgi:hypothetical protein
MSDRQQKIAQIEQMKNQIATLQSELAAAPAGAAGSQGKKRVCLLGSGNWGSAVAKILGTNAAKYDTFETEVRMWVYEEEVEVDGEKRKLTEVINHRHENVKYLPGIALPENIIAEPDVKKAAEGAHILVWVLPHQFVGRTAAGIKDVVAEGCVSCSLVKGGIDIKPEGMELCSEVIFKEFNHPVAVLMWRTSRMRWRSGSSPRRRSGARTPWARCCRRSSTRRPSACARCKRWRPWSCAVR